MNSLVTIIISSYNKEDYIFDAIDSILKQSYQYIELIIYDDCSLKFNEEEIKKYIKENNTGNIKNLVIEKNNVNLGTCKTLNNALKLVSSDSKYIRFLDADDKFVESSISNQVSFLEENQTYHLVGGKTQGYNSSFSKIIVNDRDYKETSNILKFDFNDLYRFVCKHDFLFHINAILFRKFIFDNIQFDEAYRLYQDRPMMLRMFRENFSIGVIDEVVMMSRLGVGISTSKNKDLAKDCITCVEREYFPFAGILGMRFCKNELKYNKALYILKFELKSYSLIKIVRFSFEYFPTILFRIIPSYARFLITNFNRK